MTTEEKAKDLYRQLKSLLNWKWQAGSKAEHDITAVINARMQEAVAAERAACATLAVNSPGLSGAEIAKQIAARGKK